MVTAVMASSSRATRLKRLMKSRGLSIRALADKMREPSGTIANLTSGRTSTFDSDKLAKMSTVFGIELGALSRYLLDGIDLPDEVLPLSVYDDLPDVDPGLAMFAGVDRLSAERKEALKNFILKLYADELNEKRGDD